MKTRTLLGILGISFLGAGCTGKTETVCETYQGYSDIIMPERVYVFDSVNAYSRLRVPRFSLFGNSKLKDSLNIGKKYCLTISKGFPGRIVSIKPEKNQRALAENK